MNILTNSEVRKQMIKDRLSLYSWRRFRLRGTVFVFISFLIFVLLLIGAVIPFLRFFAWIGFFIASLYILSFIVFVCSVYKVYFG